MSSLIERGKLIKNCANPENLAYFSENKQLLTDLSAKYRLEWVLGRDGKPLSMELKDWICHGSKGQLWEYGKGVLGITVEGTKWCPSFIYQTKSFCQVTQNGDGETNLKCAWTAESVAKLAKTLKLHKSPKLRSEAQKAVMRANLKVLNAPPEAVGGSQDESKAPPPSQGS